MSDPPPPGSYEAIAAGCTCPVLDNAKGQGYMRVPGLFWITAGCPLHGDTTTTRNGTVYINSHADEPRCAGCGQNHTPINQHGYCLSCWLRMEDVS